MVKIAGIVRFLSIVLFLATLAVVYAYLPAKVELLPTGDYSCSKEWFFYGMAAAFLLVNVAFRAAFGILTRRLETWDERSRAWLALLMPVVNVYITLLTGFVGVLHNPNHIPPGSYAYLNYMGPLLLVIWLIGFGWRFFMMIKKPVQAD